MFKRFVICCLRHVYASTTFASICGSSVGNCSLSVNKPCNISDFFFGSRSVPYSNKEGENGWFFEEKKSRSCEKIQIRNDGI